MLLKNSEYPLKVKFSDEAFQNVFIGVAGDNQSRVLEVTILDLDNNIYKEDIPSFKILAKGDLDKKVYYNVGTKKTAGVYTVEIPSQVFKQSQNVEIQFLIENEETHERIFSTMIKQRVQRGFCANFEEGTNIYLDYEEILKFEENFDGFLKQISQDRDEILLEMILEMGKVKDENKAEILLLKGDFEEASKDVLDTVNKLKDETDEDFKALESKISNLEDLMLEEVAKAIEEITAGVQIDLGAERDKIVLEITELGGKFKTEIETLGSGSLEAIETNSHLAIESVKSEKFKSLTELTNKRESILKDLDEAKTSSLGELTGATQEGKDSIKALSDNSIRLITSEQTQALANIKESSAKSLAEIKSQTEAELKVIKDTRDTSVVSLESKKLSCIQEIETATNEAVNTIEDKILELDTEKIMQRLNELEALITGLDDRIKANTDTIAGHTEEIKSINDSVLVHQTDIDTVTDDLNKKI